MSEQHFVSKKGMVWGGSVADGILEGQNRSMSAKDIIRTASRLIHPNEQDVRNLLSSKSKLLSSIRLLTDSKRTNKLYRLLYPDHDAINNGDMTCLSSVAHRFIWREIFAATSIHEISIFKLPFHMADELYHQLEYDQTIKVEKDGLDERKKNAELSLRDRYDLSNCAHEIALISRPEIRDDLIKTLETLVAINLSEYQKYRLQELDDRGARKVLMKSVPTSQLLLSMNNELGYDPNLRLNQMLLGDFDSTHRNQRWLKDLANRCSALDEKLRTGSNINGVKMNENVQVLFRNLADESDHDNLPVKSEPDVATLKKEARTEVVPTRRNQQSANSRAARLANRNLKSTEEDGNEAPPTATRKVSNRKGSKNTTTTSKVLELGTIDEGSTATTTKNGSNTTTSAAGGNATGGGRTTAASRRARARDESIVKYESRAKPIGRIRNKSGDERSERSESSDSVAAAETRNASRRSGAGANGGQSKEVLHRRVTRATSRQKMAMANDQQQQLDLPHPTVVSQEIGPTGSQDEEIGGGSAIVTETGRKRTLDSMSTPSEINKVAGDDTPSAKRRKAIQPVARLRYLTRTNAQKETKDSSGLTISDEDEGSNNHENLGRRGGINNSGPGGRGHDHDESDVSSVHGGQNGDINHKIPVRNSGHSPDFRTSEEELPSQTHRGLEAVVDDGTSVFTTTHVDNNSTIMVTTEGEGRTGDNINYIASNITTTTTTTTTAASNSLLRVDSNTSVIGGNNEGQSSLPTGV